jgi:hypothetical protein
VKGKTLVRQAKALCINKRRAALTMAECRLLCANLDSGWSDNELEMMMVRKRIFLLPDWKRQRSLLSYAAVGVNKSAGRPSRAQTLRGQSTVLFGQKSISRAHTIN